MKRWFAHCQVAPMLLSKWGSASRSHGTACGGSFHAKIPEAAGADTVDATLARFGIETIQVDRALARRAAAVQVRTRLKLPGAYALAPNVDSSSSGERRVPSWRSMQRPHRLPGWRRRRVALTNSAGWPRRIVGATQSHTERYTGRCRAFPSAAPDDDVDLERGTNCVRGCDAWR